MNQITSFSVNNSLEKGRDVILMEQEEEYLKTDRWSLVNMKTIFERNYWSNERMLEIVNITISKKIMQKHGILTSYEDVWYTYESQHYYDIVIIF